MSSDTVDKLFFSMSYDFLENYLEKQTGRSKHTVKASRDTLTLFRKYINEKLKDSISKFQFADCNRACVIGFLEYLKERGNSPSTRNMRLSTLRSYLCYASGRDIALESIALEISRIPPFKEPKKVKETLTEKSISALLREPKHDMKGIRNTMIMILLFDTAARLDEVLSLQLGDMNLTAEIPYIKVRGKGNKERILSMTSSTVEHLKQYLLIFHNANSPEVTLLFYNTIKDNTGKLAESTVERFIQLYADSVRKNYPEMPEHVYPHMFRAYRATQLYQDNVPLDIVSRLLGHAQLETTRIYAKPSQKMLQDAINSIEPPLKYNKTKLWEGNEERLARLCGVR